MSTWTHLTTVEAEDAWISQFLSLLMRTFSGTASLLCTSGLPSIIFLVENIREQRAVSAEAAREAPTNSIFPELLEGRGHTWIQIPYPSSLGTCNNIPIYVTDLLIAND